MTLDEIKNNEYVLMTTQYSSFVEFTPHTTRQSLIEDITTCLSLLTVSINCIFFKGQELTPLEFAQLIKESRAYKKSLSARGT